MQAIEQVERATESQDRWAFGFVITSVCLVAVLAITNRWASPVFLLPALGIPVAVIVGILILVASIILRHPHRAASTLFGLAILASIPWSIGLLDLSIEYSEFRWNRTAYDELVDVERKREPPGTPIRLLLRSRNESPSIFTTIFADVIYDETDRAGDDPESVRGDWPAGANKTELIDGRIKVRPLSGHYYYVTEVWG